MTTRALPRVEAAKPLHGFEVASWKNVHGPHQHGAAGAFDPFHGLQRGVPLLRCVELIPHRAASSLHDLVDRMIPLLNAAEYLKRPGLLRGARNGGYAFAFGIVESSTGSQQNRRFPFRSEKLDTHVDIRCVDQASRSQL